MIFIYNDVTNLKKKNGHHIGGTLMFSSKGTDKEILGLVITCLRKKI